MKKITDNFETIPGLILPPTKEFRSRLTGEMVKSREIEEVLVEGEGVESFFIVKYDSGLVVFSKYGQKLFLRLTKATKLYNEGYVEKIFYLIQDQGIKFVENSMTHINHEEKNDHLIKVILDHPNLTSRAKLATLVSYMLLLSNLSEEYVLKLIEEKEFDELEFNDCIQKLSHLEHYLLLSKGTYNKIRNSDLINEFSSYHNSTHNEVLVETAINISRFMGYEGPNEEILEEFIKKDRSLEESDAEVEFKALNLYLSIMESLPTELFFDLNRSQLEYALRLHYFHWSRKSTFNLLMKTYRGTGEYRQLIMSQRHDKDLYDLIDLDDKEKDEIIRAINEVKDSLGTLRSDNWLKTVVTYFSLNNKADFSKLLYEAVKSTKAKNYTNYQDSAITELEKIAEKTIYLRSNSDYKHAPIDWLVSLGLLVKV